MINKKPFTWEEIETKIREKLIESKHIMTFSTIGSLNIEHDIDCIITKFSASPTSGFYKEIHELFDSINKFLNEKYKGKVIRFPLYKSESEIIAKYSKNDLLFHTMIYSSLSQIKKDWEWYLFGDVKVDDILSTSKFIKGSLTDIYSKDFNKEDYYNPIFIVLYQCDKINSNYPNKYLLKVMNDNFDFLFRKMLSSQTQKASSVKEIRPIFYKFCDELDNLRRLKGGTQKRKHQ